jgi:hypothetical protein
MPDYQEMAVAACKGAVKSAALGASGSILSGAAMVTVPVKLLGLVTVGTSTVVAMPVVVTAALGCALIGGVAAAGVSYVQQRKIEKEFDRLRRT